MGLLQFVNLDIYLVDMAIVAVCKHGQLWHAGNGTILAENVWARLGL